MRPPLLALVLLAALCGGCAFMPQRPGKAIEPAVAAMHGGTAMGSGATMTTPNAAAQPSEQHAVEETVYVAEPAPVAQPAAEPIMVEFHAPGDVPAQPAEVGIVAPQPPPPPRPLWKRSETTTKIGAHQEIEPMLKQVSEIWGKLTKAHWLGIFAMIAGLGGILHAAGNKDSGYPAVWLKVFCAGLLAFTMGDALWFWILLLLAGLLYLGQKLGFIRVPGVIP